MRFMKDGTKDRIPANERWHLPRHAVPRLRLSHLRSRVCYFFQNGLGFRILGCGFRV